MMVPTRPRRLTEGVTSLIVTAASLTLLVFLAYGEAARAYLQLRLERVAASGGTLELALERSALSGLDLADIARFEQRAQSLMLLDPAIEALAIVDRDAVLIDGAVASSLPPLTARRLRNALATTAPAALSAPESRIALPNARLVETTRYYGLIHGIDSGIGPVGTLIILVDRDLGTEPVEIRFRPILIGAAAVLGLYVIFLIASALSPRLSSRTVKTSAFFCAFVATAGITIDGLVDLYAEGVQSKSEGVARSIAERLSLATSIGIDPRDLRGIPELFGRVIEENAEIAEIALVDRREVVLHNDVERIGAPFESGPGRRTEIVALAPMAPDQAALVAAVSVPVSVIAERIASQAKDFAVLFLATGLMAWHLFAIGQRIDAPTGRDPAPTRARQGRIRYRRTHRHQLRIQEKEERERTAEEESVGGAVALLVRPAYFLAIFADALLISFLPTYAVELAREADLSPTLGSLPFTVFFVGLTAVLVPASAIAERGRIKELFLIGAVLIGCSFVAMALVRDFSVLVAARALAGMGQGLLTLAMQSYGIAFAPPGRRAAALAVQIQAFNAGVISGAAIGGLLVDLTLERGVFWVAFGVAAATALYTAAVLSNPELPARTEVRTGHRGRFTNDLLASLRDAEFMTVLVLIGIVSKLILAGIVFFAAPLVLRQQGYGPDAVGQIVMFAAIGTLISAMFAARLVDRFQAARRTFLTVGGVLSGTGVLLFSLPGIAGGPGAFGVAGLTVFAAIFGLFLVGIAQALIAAPAMTQVADTPVARIRGPVRIAGLYRLLERVGHISGPTVMASLLGGLGGSPLALALVGGITVVFSAGYRLTARRRR